MPTPAQVPQTVAEIRKAFLDFFAEHGHAVVASHSLLPPADPTLLFVNAGMVQFKDYFTGARAAPYKTATSTQKCLRVSGKHNDLENVGRTRRHHTLFEMLGNFSFGDYFKEGAIRFAWRFLTEWLRLDPSRLVVTWFGGNDALPADTEARDLWKVISTLPENRILPLGEKDNFWSMGDTGPCGPCTEIYYDLDPSQGPGCSLYADDGRYMEIWNCVFMQYDRQNGHLTPLPAPCVDTGMGLERIASVVQGQSSNYATDLFLELIAVTERLANTKYCGQFDPENVVSGNADVERDVAFRVIADHARAAAFLIAEGIYPDSEGRGYVLRRVMRRAMRYGRNLGIKGPFLCEVAVKSADLLGGIFPELLTQRAVIERVTRQEEERFGQTLESGLRLISAEIGRIAAEGGAKLLPGAAVFLLHDTHGFPTDLTALICSEHGFELDMPGFDQAMAEQKARGKASWKKGGGDLVELAKELGDEGLATEFVGYEHDHAAATVLAVIQDGARVASLGVGQEGLVVLNRTCLYGEGGGQVGDKGELALVEGGRAVVLDTLKAGKGLHFHRVKIDNGAVTAGDNVLVQVEAPRRASIQAHHSATHLIHKALRDTLGVHVKQRGSLVEPGRLRFDFSHFAALTADELRAVERHANQRVVANQPAEVENTSMDVAVKRGAMAFFGDKYGDVVRVMKLGDSVELCGGTHVARTGDIGFIQIVSESAVSAGVRRIEAVCHLAAVEHVQSTTQMLEGLARRLGSGADQAGERLERVYEQLKAAQQEVERWKQKALSGSGGTDAQERTVAGIKAVFRTVEGADAVVLRNLADQTRDKLGSGVVALLSLQEGGKALLLVAATKDVCGKVAAGPLVAELAPLLGGKGGGRPDMAQAGGNAPGDVAALAEAFFAGVAKRAG